MKSKLVQKWAREFKAKKRRAIRERRAGKQWEGQQSAEALTIDELLEIENSPQPPNNHKPRESKKRIKVTPLAGMDPKIFLGQKFGKCTVNSEEMRMKGDYNTKQKHNVTDQKEWYRKPEAEYREAVRKQALIKTSGKTSLEVAAKQQKIKLKERVIYETFTSPLDLVITVPSDMDDRQFKLDASLPYNERPFQAKMATWRLYHGARLQYFKLLNEMLEPQLLFDRAKLDYYEGFFRMFVGRDSDRVKAYPIPTLELYNPEKRIKSAKILENREKSEGKRKPGFASIGSKYFFRIKTWFVFSLRQP
jgi:hypothetical protein